MNQFRLVFKRLKHGELYSDLYRDWHNFFFTYISIIADTLYTMAILSYESEFCCLER